MYRQSPNDGCVICLDTIIYPQWMTCGHVFCLSCIVKCGSNCPTCRAKIYDSDDGISDSEDSLYVP